jgi:hypothetical protein
MSWRISRSQEQLCEASLKRYFALHVHYRYLITITILSQRRPKAHGLATAVTSAGKPSNPDRIRCEV